MPPNTYPGLPNSGRRTINVLLIPFILAVLALVGALVFGIWAYGGRQDYKNNVQKKVDDAVIIAKQVVTSEKEKEFDEKAKSPYKTYSGSATYGSVNFQYPRDWSAYVEEQVSSTAPVDGYFHPNFVPGIKVGSAYALRIQITNQDYATELKNYESQVATGKVKITAFRAAKVSSTLGAKIDGEINTGQKDIMIMVPLRDKALKVWTESSQFINDFENIILPSLSFVP